MSPLAPSLPRNGLIMPGNLIYRLKTCNLANLLNLVGFQKDTEADRLALRRHCCSRRLPLPDRLVATMAELPPGVQASTIV